VGLSRQAVESSARVAPDAPVPSAGTPAVRAEAIRKSFGDNVVLDAVDLTVGAGQVLVVIGPSGSGKSTLLRCINLLEMPTSGRIVVAGEEIRLGTDRKGRTIARDARQVERIRTRLGMVFQSFNLWAHRTVLENVIEMPVHVLHEPRAEAIERAEQLLERVGLADKRLVYPAFLSGGQQQRVAIARALAMRPQVMLFDEPTSALDPERVGEVLKVIRDLACEGRTMLLVTHEMDFARDVSSKVIFLHQGRIEESGTPEQVFGAPQSERCRQFVTAHEHRR
jgi:octopine/nopaline transport system ATP-binding protein